MSEGANGLMENVMKFTSSSGSIAAFSYQVLSTIVGDLGSDSTQGDKSDSSATMSSPKTSSTSSFFSKSWLRGRRSSSSSKYSAASGYDQESSLALFTLQDVSHHDAPHDCWMVLYDRVYDVTDFLDTHPGGEEVMLEYAGHDATLAFRSVGHSKEAEEALKPYLIGILVESERIWTRFFNMKSDVP